MDATRGRIPGMSSHHRSDLQRVAHQAMLDRGLETEFAADALAQLHAIQGPSAADGGLEDLRSLLWCSVFSRLPTFEPEHDLGAVPESDHGRQSRPTSTNLGKTRVGSTSYRVFAADTDAQRNPEDLSGAPRSAFRSRNGCSCAGETAKCSPADLRTSLGQ